MRTQQENGSGIASTTAKLPNTEHSTTDNLSTTSHVRVRSSKERPQVRPRRASTPCDESLQYFTYFTLSCLRPSVPPLELRQQLRQICCIPRRHRGMLCAIGSAALGLLSQPARRGETTRSYTPRANGRMEAQAFNPASFFEDKPPPSWSAPARLISHPCGHAPAPNHIRLLRPVSAETRAAAALMPTGDPLCLLLPARCRRACFLAVPSIVLCCGHPGSPEWKWGSADGVAHTEATKAREEFDKQFRRSALLHLHCCMCAACVLHVCCMCAGSAQRALPCLRATIHTYHGRTYYGRSSLLSWAKLGSADYVELKMVQRV